MAPNYAYSYDSHQKENAVNRKVLDKGPRWMTTKPQVSLLTTQMFQAKLTIRRWRDLLFECSASYGSNRGLLLHRYQLLKLFSFSLHQLPSFEYFYQYMIIFIFKSCYFGTFSMIFVQIFITWLFGNEILSKDENSQMLTKRFTLVKMILSESSLRRVFIL